MSYIKVRGIEDTVEVSRDLASELKQKWLSDKWDPEEKVDLGAVVCRARDIRSIQMVSAPSDPNRTSRDAFTAYVEDRKRLRAMFPAEKAKASKGHFCLFYWMVYQTSPPPELIEEAVKKAQRFFELNLDWCVPSMKLWFSFLKIPHEQPLQPSSFKILEGVEHNEVGEIKRLKEYRKKKLEEAVPFPTESHA